MIDGLIGAVVGIVVFVVVMVVYARLSAMRERAMNAAAVARRRERQEQLGPIAKAATASVEELAQMRKDRQDFFSMTEGPYWGTAEYNNAQEQAILQGARNYAAVDGVSLKEGMQRYYSATVGYGKGTLSGTPVSGVIASGYIGSDLVYVPSYSGTISADEVAHADRQRSANSGTPDPREYRP